VAINLHRLELDNYGKIWVSSRGDYYKVPSKIFVFDPKTEQVTKTLDVSCSNMTLAGDSLFVYSTERTRSATPSSTPRARRSSTATSSRTARRRISRSPTASLSIESRESSTSPTLRTM